MMRLLSDAPAGKRNILFGAFLFVFSAVVLGVPLTLSFFGLPVLSPEVYPLWKVVHGYAIFLAVINLSVGAHLDRLNLTPRWQGLLSWSFIVAALFGGIGRMALIALGLYADWHLAASLGEVVAFSIGLALFVYGWFASRSAAVQVASRMLEPVQRAERSEAQRQTTT